MPCEIKPWGTVKDFMTEDPPGTWAVARVEMDEGAFMGYRVEVIDSLYQLSKLKDLPCYQVPELGGLSLYEAATLAFKDQPTFVAVFKESDV